MGLFKNDKGGCRPTGVGTSAPQNTSVGSGSRPTQSKIGIPTSAPENPQTLGEGMGRDVKGSLK